MLPRWGSARAVVVVVLVLGAGCGGVAGVHEPVGSTPTVTPAPVPGGTTTPTATPGTAVGNGSGVIQSRYLSLRPTCDRPPELVTHIQIGALANNDPATNAGIDATWRFVAPATRRSIGSYADFVERVTRRYRPLLNAEEVTYGPLDKEANVAARKKATQRVEVTEPDGSKTTYIWQTERQTEGEYRGCWMMTSVQAGVG